MGEELNLLDSAKQEQPQAGAVVEVREAAPPPVENERLRALMNLVEFQKALETYIRSLVPEERVRWVENKKTGERKPVLTRQEYATLFRGFGLTEPEPPVFHVRELPGGELLFECQTRVVWPLMGTQAYGVGCAATDEVADRTAPMGRRVHDAKAKAHTRAWERAIANLLGLGCLGEEEAMGSPELEAVPPAMQYVLKLAQSRGISEAEVKAYVEARFGKNLSGLNAQQIVALKLTIENIGSREQWEKEMAKWTRGKPEA